MPNSVSNVVPPGLTNGMPDGLPAGLPDSQSKALPNSFPDSLSDNLRICSVQLLALALKSVLHTLTNQPGEKTEIYDFC